MTVANYQKLAEIYGASDIGMLTLPPVQREQVAAVREALRLATELPPDQRADWLASGRVLRAAAAADKKSRDT